MEVGRVEQNDTRVGEEYYSKYMYTSSRLIYMTRMRDKRGRQKKEAI